ncbi:solute carrier organic anion transporter family member 74D [Chironomus tepperi]|uniref:solute carrier organic anion transporter family member 74D n=1 Tax=Chironomus tepperi TaxID=113505 RepID=UPI00391FA23B
MLIDMNETNETDNFSDGRDLPLINVKDVPQKSVIAFNDNNTVDNNNSINNSYDYNMDMKTNGNNKNTEEDPLTGQREFVLNLQKGTDTNLRWRNKFASTNFFMVVFLLAYVLQGCYFTYFVSVITTIEKLFQIKSAVIALLLNFSEAGQIATSLFLTYFAGRGHRPRWIACGMLLFSLAAFGSVLPHFIFGKQLYSQNEISPQVVTTSIMNEVAAVNMTTDLNGLNLCLKDNVFFNQTVASTCNGDNNEQTFNNSVTLYVLIILAVSLLGIGIGQTAIATLGIPYIDDNVQSKQSPLYMAITIGVRILGPALGYYLGSVCMRISYDFSTDKIHTDPGFTGAWYLGLLLVSTSMFFASLVMFTFPKTLRNKTTKVQPIDVKTNADDSKNEEAIVVADTRPKFKDFGKTIKRQLRNDILMFRTASAVLHLLPITGLYVFLPKYLETQFHLPPADANWISGTFGILVMGVGIFVTGVISVKFPLSAKKVSLWIAFTALATALGLFVLSTLGCSMDNYAGLQKSSSGSIANSLEFVLPCNKTASCGCDTDKFSPICGADGRTYFSACHAGCFDSTKDVNSSSRMYHNCSCIDDAAPINAIDGFCKTESCSTVMVIFITVFALTVFIHSTSEVGGMLIIMRCTHPKDKSMAMGIVQFSLGLLSNIPCPHIFGRIIDATCIVWNKVCSENSYCSFYNADTFRKYFFGVSCFIMLIAFVMDMIVFFKSHRIDIDPEGNEPEADTSNKELQNEDQGEEDLLRLRKLTPDVDEEQHTKLGM